MNNTRDNTPEMDYYELRRQREEYKQRMRMEQNAQHRSPAPASPAPETVETPVSAQPQPEFVEEAVARPEVKDAFEAAIEQGYQDYEDEIQEDEDEIEGDINPNPFDSFIHFFHGVKSSISARHERMEDQDDWDEEAFDSEEQDAPVHPSRPQSQFTLPMDELASDSHAMDIEDDLPRDAQPRLETSFDEDDSNFADEDFEDEDAPHRQSGFKKFMGLFVERVDEANDYEDEDEAPEGDDFESEFDPHATNIEEDFEEEEEDAPRRRSIFGRLGRKGRMNDEPEEEEEEEEFFPIRRDEHVGNPEGGYTMEENKTTISAPQQSAPAAESVGMTRRERRELAMRLAAEEAARKAEEEAARKAEEEKRAAEEKSIALEPLFADETAEEKVDMGVFEDAPETDLLVETTAQEAPVVDEPTRKFTPVNMRDVHEAENSNLFSVDDEDDDEDDDEEEIVEKKPRFSLFGKKKSAADEDDDEDYDDEDEEDEYDDDDEDDDEEELVEKKPRRGLFGRKKASDEDEEEDDEDYDEDEDEYDDDSDSDDDDEYDEYDDEEDDEDYDDDEYDDEDEPRRSFGHHLLGIFKIILGIIAVLAIALVVCNFLYMAGHTTIVDHAHNAMGDSAAFNAFFPCYGVRANLPVASVTVDELDLEEGLITPEPTALPTPEATVSIPNLDGASAQSDSNIVSAPVVETAPVVEAAPVEEAATAAPVEGAVG